MIGRLATFWWSSLPRLVVRVWPALARNLVDGSELRAIPLLAALGPIVAFALGALCGFTIPGYEATFTGSLAVMSVLVFVGCISQGLGVYAMLGFVVVDLGPGHHIDLGRIPIRIAALAVSYAVLATLVVGAPGAARGLGRLVTRRVAWIAIALPTLVMGLAAYAWTQAAPLLVRPLWIWNGSLPSSEQIAPVQTHGIVVAAVATVAMLVSGVLRRRLVERAGPGTTVLLDASRGPQLPLPLAIALRALGSTIFVGGLLGTFGEWLIAGAAFAGIFLVNASLTRVAWYARAIDSIHPVLRVVAALGLNYACAATIVPALYYSTQGFLPILYPVLASGLIAAVLFPKRTAPVVRAALLFAACLVPAPALADNCSSLGDCFSAGEWAVIAAVAIAAVVLFPPLWAAAAAADAAAAAAAEAAAVAAADAAATVAADAAAAAAADAAAAAAADAAATAAADAAAEVAAAEAEAAAADAAAADAAAAEAEAAAAAEAEAEAAAQAEAAATRAELENGLGSIEGNPAPPGTVNELPPEFDTFQTGANQNCGPTSVNVDQWLGGGPAESPFGNTPTDLGTIENYAGTNAVDASLDGIAEQMENAGPGARGIVYVSDGAGNAHVFNVINQGGEIVAIDGQTGVYGSLSDVAAHDGYGAVQGAYDSVTQTGWSYVPTFP